MDTLINGSWNAEIKSSFSYSLIIVGDTDLGQVISKSHQYAQHIR